MPGTRLLLHKYADKSGTKAEGEAWPLTHVALDSDVPDEWGFSDGFVDQAVKDGWITYEGEPITYEVMPDPLGPMKNAAPLTMTIPGDVLVLSLVKNGEPVSVKYAIVSPPVPRFFRHMDGDDIRVEHDYKVKVQA